MSRNHLKHIGFVCGIVFILLLCSAVLLKPTQPAAEKKQRVSVNTPRKPKILALRKETLSDFQKSAFYRTIIDNNLFRPLGWTPPRPREPYRLLGTVLPTDANTPKRAILQATAGNKTYTVGIGETLGESTLTDIQAKQVTLKKDGVPRTLKLNTTPLLK